MIAETYRLKMRVSETQKANANDKLQVANLTEEVENLNKNIVPSPQVRLRRIYFTGGHVHHWLVRHAFVEMTDFGFC